MRLRYVIFLRYTPPPKILGAPAHAGVVTECHMCRDVLFPYGHSVRPGQSSGSGDVQISTSCPRPHCLPIRRRVTTIVDFDPILLIPSQSRNIQQSIESVAETSTRKSIHPNYLHGRAYQPPFARPTRQVARRGLFFVSDFSRASKCTHLMLMFGASKWTRDGFALERVKLRPKRVVRLLAFALSHIVDGRPRLMSYRASRARVCMRPMQIGEKEKAFFSERPTFADLWALEDEFRRECLTKGDVTRQSHASHKLATSTFSIQHAKPSSEKPLTVTCHELRT